MIKLELPTPINKLKLVSENEIYIKRDDMTGLSMGGNKARKIQYFMEKAIDEKADCIVTYGDMQSNHCRVTSAAATINDMEVYLIHPESNTDLNFNGNYMINSLYEPKIIYTKLDDVSITISKTLKDLKDEGKKPFFIEGGGHGNLGTHAYKKAFEEIIIQEKEINIKFDYIFHASGTGTTQAGLIAGKIQDKHDVEIIGISIARSKKHGSEVILKSLENYLGTNKKIIEKEIKFIPDYIGLGYADVYSEVLKTIKKVAKTDAILMDPVYTGKAFYGMEEYLKKEGIVNKKILFIHTGGLPLLFNYAEKLKEI